MHVILGDSLIEAQHPFHIGFYSLLLSVSMSLCFNAAAKADPVQGKILPRASQQNSLEPDKLGKFYRRLDRLEDSVFHQKSDELVTSRIAHLEKHYFDKTFDDPLKVRLDRLIVVSLDSKSSDPAIAEEAPKPKTSTGIDWESYLVDLKRRFRMAWFPPKGEENRYIVVRLTIDEDGKLIKAKIAKSSGRVNADQAVIKAVESSAPFRSLPFGSPKVVDLEFKFDGEILKE